MSEHFPQTRKAMSSARGISPDANSLAGLHTSLKKILPGNSVLGEARKRILLPRTQMKADLYCELCGLPIYGTSYFQQRDGKYVCAECHENSVKTTEELEKLYQKCCSQMKRDLNAELKTKGITVELASIAQESSSNSAVVYRIGSPAVKNSSKKGLILGQVLKTGDSYTLQIENGVSRIVCMYVLVCELTFLWQQDHWKSDLQDLCNRDCPGHEQRACDDIHSAMTCWAGVEFLYLNGETAYAHQFDQYHIASSAAYRLYRKMYPFQSAPSRLIKKPFMKDRYPLDLRQLNYLYNA